MNVNIRLKFNMLCSQTHVQPLNMQATLAVPPLGGGWGRCCICIHSDDDCEHKGSAQIEERACGTPFPLFSDAYLAPESHSGPFSTRRSSQHLQWLSLRVKCLLQLFKRRNELERNQKEITVCHSNRWWSWCWYFLVVEICRRRIIPGRVIMLDCIYQAEMCCILNVYAAIL